MANINLLPWREELRAERNREFGVVLGFTVFVAAMGVLGVNTVFKNKIASQEYRNRMLTQEITMLDKKIQDIKKLEQEKKELLNRIEIVEALQRSRPLVVRLFDELVRLMPDGVHLDSLKRRGNILEMMGKTESHPRVANFMRNIESSQWITKPVLKNIVADAKGKSAVSDFSLQAEVVTGTKKEGEE